MPRKENTWVWIYKLTNLSSSAPICHLAKELFAINTLLFQTDDDCTRIEGIYRESCFCNTLVSFFIKFKTLCSKAKTWERDRRKRMNTYFKTLADLLPPHQEGRKLNKVDILIHATKYIKDLHSRTEELFSNHATDAHSMYMWFAVYDIDISLNIMVSIYNEIIYNITVWFFRGRIDSLEKARDSTNVSYSITVYSSQRSRNFYTSWTSSWKNIPFKMVQQN